MAEVRCPMCGKANPADRKECQFCQARLQPTWDSALNMGTTDSSEDQASDLPDWLKSLRTPDVQPDEPSTPKQKPSRALTDWLGELREQPDIAESSQSDQISEDRTGTSEDSASAWLQGFLSEDDPATEANFSKQLNYIFRQDEAGWISRIGTGPIEEEPPPQDSSDTLDWLTGQEKTAAELNATRGKAWTAQPNEYVEPLPDWLSQTEPETTELPGQETIPPASEPRLTPELELPAELAADEELPAWLQQAAASIQEAAEPVDGSMPEWARLEQVDATEQQSVPGEGVNWPVAKDEESLPAWLFTGTSPAGPEEPTETPPAEKFSADQAERPVPEAEAVEPDLLKPSLEAQEEAAIPILEKEPAPAGLFLDVQQPAPEVAEPETPEEEMTTPVGAAAAAIGLGAVLSNEQAEEALDWLGDLEASYGLSPNALDESGAVIGEAAELGQQPDVLPGWLARASEADAQSLEGVADGEAELKPADLPSWLQAMRPVGVMAAAASLMGGPELQPIEGAGPLAGLRGALPAEPDVSQVQKSPVYSVKLRVNETQQAQADLLRSLIESEGQGQVLPGRPAISSQDVIRLFITVVLILSILYVILTGSPQLSLPPPSPEVNAVGQFINELPAGAPVLLAVDYQPGFSGEMDAVTVPVVQHLFERNATLVLVSTISTGPVQAEHLVTQALASGDEPLIPKENLVNLGYIPGGATGLLAFAQSPREILPTSIRGEKVWETGMLQGVDGPEKFSLVIVATENPDVARNWIEQVQPQLGATPMVMALSAQAEPLVWPYYHASPPQVQGLLGGLAGGVAYLAYRAQVGAATRYWSPYSVGAWIAGLLMVLGGIMNLVSAEIKRQKEKAGGEKRS